MSTMIMAACWPLMMSASQKAVLISLADQASDDGVCWPGIGTIARRTCLSERAVQEAIAWLQKTGVVYREYRSNTSTSYTIKPRNYTPANAPEKRVRKSEGGAGGAPGEHGAPGAGGAPGGEHGAPGGAGGAPLGVQEAHPNRKGNRHRTVNESLQPALPAAIDGSIPSRADPEIEKETQLQAACRETWKTYAKAYAARYGAAPVRNAPTNAKVKQFVQRIGGDEAPGVAEFFVNNVSEAFVVRGCHSVGTLLQNAEAYRTQWATGQSMTATRARQIDQSQANYSAADEAIALMRARRSNQGAANA